MKLVKGYSKKLFLVVLALSIAIEAAALIFAQAGAQTSPVPSEDQVNSIASQLYCPVCSNVPLDECQTQVCVQFRDEIRAKLTEGWNAKQIKQYFVDQYGDQVLPVPPPGGLNWILYIFPLAILAGAGWMILRFFKRSPQPGFDIEPEAQTHDPALLEKLKDDLLEDK